MAAAENRFVPPTPQRRAEDAAYDAAEPVAPRTSVLIASEHRSGSTLLSWAMWSTGVAGLPAEYFLTRPIQIFHDRWGVPRPTLRGRLGRLRRRWFGGPAEYLRYRPSSFPPFVARLAENRSTPNAVFSMKMMYPQLEVLTRHGHDHTLFPGRTVWIRLRRRDRVRQAISRARASATRRYHSSHAPDAPDPPYDRERIEHYMEATRRYHESWTHYLDGRGIDYLDLWYEDLVADYEGALEAVFDHAGIERPARWPDPPLRPLADELTEAWVERYRAGH